MSSQGQSFGVIQQVKAPTVAGPAPRSDAANPDERGDIGGLRKRFDYPKNFGDTVPEIVKQPSIKGRTLSIGVYFTAWRTSTKHLASKWDKYQAQIRISKKNYQIRNVTGSAADAPKIAYKKTAKKHTLKASGVKTFNFTLPSGVAKQLRKYSKNQRLSHVQFVARQWKDVTRVKGYDAQMIGQSDQWPTVKKQLAPNRSSKAARDLPQKRNAEKTQNPRVSVDILNYSPFTLSGSMAGSNCMDNVSTVNATIAPGQSIFTFAVPMVNQGTANSQSTWKTVTQGTVQTIGTTAQTNSGAFEQGIAAATTPGLVATGTEFATNFLGNLIGNIAKNECQNSAQSQTLTMSWTATDYASGTSYSAANWNKYATQGPGYGTSQTVAQSGAAITTPVTNPLPSNQLALYPGAQSSVQWNWNGANVNMDGPGGSYFSGGLTAISQAWNMGDNGDTYVGNWTFALTFDDTADVQYGPNFNGPVTTNVGASPSYPLNCVIPSDAELITPFPNATAQSFSNPSQGISLTGDTTASFVQNTGSGWGVIPGTQQVTAGFTGGSSSFWNLSGAYSPSTSYGCTLSAAAQVPDYPATTGGLQMNLGWLSYPSLVAVAP